MIRALKTGSLVLMTDLFFTGAALTTLREAITSINAGADVNADVTLTRVGAYGTNDTTGRCDVEINF
jgi:hypothetical protein